MKEPFREETETFWIQPKSFPLGRYCFEYQREFGTKEQKDCATCYWLRFGKCSKGLMPNIVKAKDALIPFEFKEGKKKK